MDRTVGVKDIVNEIMGHRGSGMSPGDYVLLFVMNTLSHPRSKNGMAEWMATDFASTIYSQVSSQGYWNVMDWFMEPQISEIKVRIRGRLISMDYDRSRIFIDGSNFYTYMRGGRHGQEGL